MELLQSLEHEVTLIPTFKLTIKVYQNEQSVWVSAISQLTY